MKKRPVLCSIGRKTKFLTPSYSMQPPISESRNSGEFRISSEFQSGHSEHKRNSNLAAIAAPTIFGLFEFHFSPFVLLSSRTQTAGIAYQHTQPRQKSVSKFDIGLVRGHQFIGSANVRINALCSSIDDDRIVENSCIVATATK